MQGIISAVARFTDGNELESNGMREAIIETRTSITHNDGRTTSVTKYQSVYRRKTYSSHSSVWRILSSR